MLKPASLLCLLGVILWSLFGFEVRTGRLQDEGPSPARTPAEELATFQLEPDLEIQLVAAEPMVQEPVVMTFDAAGRLWVVEMRGFMPTIDGTGEGQQVGRVSVLEDTTGDGQMDRSHIYIDSLIMPRALALVDGGALIAENGALWLTTDVNGDLRADTKTLIDKEYAVSALPEHAPNGLWRSMDNWYYNAKSRFRYRPMKGKSNVAQWQRDSTELRGQWGISHDNAGHLFYNYNWSQLHADLVPPNYLSRNRNHTPTTGIDHGLTLDRRVYPIRPTPAVNRGYIPGTLDKEGRLLEFTAACSPFVYRGTVLPVSYQGNAFVCEPSGNLVKRNVVQEKGLLLTAHDPHPGREFLASTDERFRPVFLATGPDGALYVADMYRGLIQHGAYITPYLRDQTLTRQLVQPIHRGRIWRIVPKNWKAQTQKHLSDESSAELVGTLSHPNGWHRDMAQRLLVERTDTTVRQALTELALRGTSDVGRFHALWTLDGLQLTTPNILFQALADPNPVVSNTALRLLEPFARRDKAVRSMLGTRLLQQQRNASVKQVLQIVLSASVLDQPVAQQLLLHSVERYDTSALIRDAVLSSLPHQEFAFLQRLWPILQAQTSRSATEIFVEMLTMAIIRERNPAQLATLLALLYKPGQPWGWVEKTVLTGLAIGGSGHTLKPVKLSTPPKLFTQPSGNIEPSRLAAAATLFDWPGHVAASHTMVKKSLLSDDEQKQFAAGRQFYLSTCAGCHGTDGAGLKRFAPPLAGSDWVVGNEKRLALILLHGMEGPVSVGSRVYDVPDILPVMPAHSTMDDAALTAILMYIRNEWGNQAGPIGKRVVGMTRVTAQGRVVPWTARELDKYVADQKAEGGK